jgi:hypothetical protein
LTRGDRFRFGFLGQKPVQTGLTRFFSWFSQFWLGFSGFGSVFFGFGSVWFFRFFACETEPAGFFKILIGFFGYFFFGFLGLICFSVFLLTSTINQLF